jgi:O-antigen ligase
MADAALPRPTPAWAGDERSRPRSEALDPARQAPRFAFWMLAFFMFLEYLRPPVIVQFKLQMLIVVVLPVMWLTSRDRPWTPILTCQLLFFAWCVKALPIASNWFNVYFTSRVMFGNIAIALAFTWVGSNLRDLRRLLWLWLALMSYQAVWALGHGGKGTGGFLGDENDLALACGTALPFALAGFERMRGLTRWALGSVAVLCLLGIVASFSRGGFVGLVLCLGYLFVSSRQKVRSLLAVAAGILIVFSFASQEYIDEMKTIQDTDEGTAKGRKFLWTSAYNMWLDNPILGVGASNAPLLIGRYQPTNFTGREYNERDWSGLALHSAWFTLLSEHGIVGVVIFASMLGIQFTTIRRLRRDVRKRSDVPDDLRRQTETMAIGVNAAIISFVGSATFLSVLYYPYLWYFTAFAGALDLAVRRELALLDQRAPRAPAAA